MMPTSLKERATCAIKSEESIKGSLMGFREHERYFRKRVLQSNTSIEYRTTRTDALPADFAFDNREAVPVYRSWCCARCIDSSPCRQAKYNSN